MEASSAASSPVENAVNVTATAKTTSQTTGNDSDESKTDNAVGALGLRHFSTIGIHDVFMEGPTSHSLPSEYFSQSFQFSSSFCSDEITGILKTHPEDFVVRELGNPDQNRIIPGLSPEDSRNLLQLARILPPSELPQQEIRVPETNEKSLPTTESNTKETGNIDIMKESTPPAAISPPVASPKEILRNAILHACISHNANSPSEEEDADGLLQRIHSLHESSIQRISTLDVDTNNGSNSNPSEIRELLFPSIWIPPLVATSQTTEDSTAALRQLRGSFHRALKSEYPLLSSKSATKADIGTEHWIMITRDDSYDALIPYLHQPTQDIVALLAFQKRGFSAADNETEKDTVKHLVLKLKPTISKEERRTIHRIIAEKCKYLSTDTLQNVPLNLEDSNQETTTVAIRISWQKHMVQRAQQSRNKKRKRGDKGKPNDNFDPYPNVLLVMKKRQKEHLSAIQRVTRALRCRPSDVGIAGIKDLQAVTYQFLTIRNMKPGRVISSRKQLENCGIELGNIYKVDWVLNNGDLEGNQFEIVLRNLQRIKVSKDPKTDRIVETHIKCEQEHVKALAERVARSGFVNFFGEQRVGAPGTTEQVGVRAFDIGRAMLRHDFGQAIELIMIGRSPTLSREGTMALTVRKVWKDTSGDVTQALKVLGNGDFMTRERLLLKGLKRYGKDRPLDALKCLAHSVRIFWINAYQSYVWNRCASERIQRLGTSPVVGDLYQEKGASRKDIKVVGTDDIGKIDISQVVLPLPGYHVRYPDNEIAQVYQNILNEDGVVFEKSAPMEATAKGSYRRLIVKPVGMTFKSLSDSTDNNEDRVHFSFQLPKGCYATMCLRELMYTTNAR